MTQQNKQEPINILGTNVHPYTVHQLHEQISDFIIKKKHKLILNVNVHCLNLAYRNPRLQNFLNSAEIVFCDGAGVMLGARILGNHIPERITYADWTWQVAQLAEKQDFSFFLLGGKDGVASKSAKQLKKQYPKLRVAGTHHGYFNKTPGNPENKEIIKQINDSQADILLVAFGMPLQEEWLINNWDKINANIALTGGAVFDYISGDLRRGPQWLTNNGFEWLARLIIEPRRLWKRYVIGNPLFLFRIVKQKLTT